MIRIDRLGRSGMFLVALLAGGGMILTARLVDERQSMFGSPSRSRQASKQIDHEVQGTLARLEAKKRVIGKVIAGRLTLLEAAAWFRALDHLPPAFYWERFRISHSGNSDDERHCREVIAWLENSHEDDCLGGAQAAQFTEELKEHLKRGPLSLPEIHLDSADEVSD